jgi:outer membrane scaffolding protein for murein synthesis (MipA/OmpV family)
MRALRRQSSRRRIRPEVTIVRRLLLLLAGFVALLPGVTSAQAADDEKYVGIGARIRPAYESADSNRADAIPYLRLYGEHVFARTTQGVLEGGWRSRPIGGVVFGGQLAYEEGRITGDSAFLKAHGFEDLRASVSLGLHAEGDWTIGPVPLNALLRYRHDVDADNGAQADLRVTAGILDWHGTRAGWFAQLTWGDAKSTQRYFGISAQQAVTTGLAPYNAGAGIRSLQTGLVGDVDLARHWIGLWGLSLQQEQADAGDSPIVQQRTTWSANAGVAYRF